MPFTTYTLTGDLANFIGADYDPSKSEVRIVLEASDPITTDGIGSVRVGDVEGSIAADGTFSFTGVPATTSGAPVYRVVITWQDAGSRRQRQLAIGWFSMTANADLAAKVLDTFTPTVITPTVAANIEAAAALGATNDTATASYVNDPASATSAALKASYVKVTEEPPNPHRYGAIADGTPRPLSTIYGSLADAQAVFPFVTSLDQQLDWAAIQKALNTLPPVSGTNPRGGVVQLRLGKFIIRDPIKVPNGAELVGAGEAATAIQAAATFVGTAMIGPAEVGQNFMHASRMALAGNGVAPLGLLFDQAYVNSGASRTVISNCLDNGVQVRGLAPLVAGVPGPVFLEDVWTYDNGKQGILVDGSHVDAWLSRVTSENNGAGYAQIHIRQPLGAGAPSPIRGTRLHGIHVEFSTADPGILLENSYGVSIDTVTYDGAGVAGSNLLKIVGTDIADHTTDQYTPSGIHARNLSCGGMAVCVNDVSRGVTLPGPLVTEYSTHQPTYYRGVQLAVGGPSLLSGTGVPAAGLGKNGDVYVRSDGGAGTALYQKRAGVWVAIA